MFKAATHQFVQSVGKKTLHPTPSIDEASNVRLGQLVIKTTKRHFIFNWKAAYHPSEFQLSDVMTDIKPLSGTPKTEDLVDYNKTTKLSLKGKFGAELVREIIDVDLEGKDSILLDIKFGKVTKSELPEPDLLADLNRRHINMDHPLIRQLRNDSRKSLCVITGVCQLLAGGSVHRQTNADLVAKASSSLVKNSGLDNEVEYDKDRDIKFPASMAVAYNLRELNVDKKTGAIQLVLTEGLCGGFKNCVGYDEVDATTDVPSPVELDIPGHNLLSQLEEKLSNVEMMFGPVTTLPVDERRRLTSDLVALLSTPRDIHFLIKLVESTENKQQNKVTISDMAANLISPQDNWTHLLTTVGFTIKDDVIIQPLDDPPLLQCLGEFLDAATMLSDEEALLISGCSPVTAPALLSVLKDGLRGKKVEDRTVTDSVLNDEAASKLLLELEFQIHGGHQIISSSILVPSIDAVYWVVYCLWGNQQ